MHGWDSALSPVKTQLQSLVGKLGSYKLNGQIIIIIIIIIIKDMLVSHLYP